MHIIVGLGNPGSKYEQTRHNYGFWVVDEMTRDLSLNWDSKFDCNFLRFQLEGSSCLLVKPQSYMNLSGEALKELINFYKFELDSLLVVHDDLDIEVGQLKFKNGGSAAGHRGVENIISHFGSKFFRLRLGIGRPENQRIEISDWVLKKPSEQERKILDETVTRSVNAVKCFIKDGFVKAQNDFNNIK